jgi:hypothetical protein
VQGTNLAVNPIFGSRLGVLGGSITSFFLTDLNPSDLRCPIFPSLLAAGGGGGQIPPTPDPMIPGRTRSSDPSIFRGFDLGAGEP